MTKCDQILEDIYDSLVNMNADKTEDLVKKALDKGVSPSKILSKSLSKGMERVGELYETQKYFLTELVVAAEIMNKSMLHIIPMLKRYAASSSDSSPNIKMIIGTVSGDIHDIGKNIVKVMAIGVGFEVTDLGVDVSSKKFVEEVKKIEPDILALSALLSTTAKDIKEVIEALKEANLRDSLKIVVGGRALTEDLAKEYGADEYGEDAIKALKIFQKLSRSP